MSNICPFWGLLSAAGPDKGAWEALWGPESGTARTPECQGYRRPRQATPHPAG